MADSPIPLTSANDSWQKAVKLFTGYDAPARDTLFQSLVGNEGIPQMKVEITKQSSVTYVDVDDLDWMVENSGWRIENTDFVIPFYATSDDTASAGDQVSMYKARFTLLGNKSTDGPPVGGVVEGGEFKSQYEEHLGLSGDKATWSTQPLTQYSYGTGRALEALLYQEQGTHGFSWNGRNVNNDQAVTLASFDTAADAFDRAAQFFVDRATVIEEWETRLGLEENDAWRGQAAGVFWNLVHTLGKQYAGYAKDMRPEGTTGSLQGNEIRQARTDFRNAVVELHRRWMDWELYMGNPLRWLHDLLKEIADHVWHRNIRQITYKVHTTGGYYTTSTYTTYHTTGAFSQNAYQLGKPDDFGPLTGLSTWKKVGERAIENWQASVIENLVKPADEALRKIHNSWSTANFDLGSVHTRSGESLTSSYTSDVNEKEKEAAEKAAADAAKSQADFMQWQKDQAAKAEAAAAAAKAEAERKEKEQEAKEAAAKAEAERKEGEARAEAERKEREARAEAERKEREAGAEAERKEREAGAKEAAARAEQEQKEAGAKAEQEAAQKEQEAKEAELLARQEAEQAEAGKQQEEYLARQEALQVTAMNQAKAEQDRARREQEAEEAGQEAKEERLRAEQEAKEEQLRAEQERKEEEAEKKQEEYVARQEALQAEQQARQEAAIAEAEREQEAARAEQEAQVAEQQAQLEEARKQAEEQYQRQSEGLLDGGGLPGTTISGPVYSDTVDLAGLGAGDTAIDSRGRLVTEYPDGTTVTIDPATHSATVERPDGTSTSGPLNTGDLLTNPDGSVSRLDPQGRVVTEYPDGGTSTTDPETGLTTYTAPDGTTTTGYLNGGGTSGSTGSSYGGSAAYDWPSYEEELYDDTPYDSPLTGAPAGIGTTDVAAAAALNGTTPLNTGILPGSSLTGNGSGIGTGTPMSGMPMGGMPMGGTGAGGQGQSSSERVRNVIDGGQVVGNRGPRGTRGTASANRHTDEADIALPRSATATTGGTPFLPPVGGSGGPGQTQTQSGDRVRDAWVQEEEDVWGTDEGGAPAVIGR
ncbi:AAWKG family protein [Streptomyces sp. GC420]|uniref:AAWKG family protein n=1 Tax=Streptomyces sp. GC420 TaxID=2697568 RepID=UPI00141505CB|nr:AAWKG family protein [Streptomyces sp. GC420]NBM15785.1 microtubule/TRAF3 and DISC1 binding protein [Streptomyces sp. GC420]